MKIEDILNLKENQLYDFKRAKIKPSDLLDLIIGFANSLGGKVILGLADEKDLGNRLYGVSENENLLSEIEKLVTRDIEPNIVIITKQEIEIINNKNQKDSLVILSVSRSSDIVSKRSGDTFLRKGDQNVKIGASEIIKLKYERGSISVESENSNINDLDCLDIDLLNKYKKDNNSSSEDDWQFLKDQGLTLKINGTLYLTKGAVLLFGKNPTISLKMKNSVKISRYFGTDIIYSNKPNMVHKPISVEGPLLKQIEETLKYFNDIKKTYSPVLKENGFTSSYLIPESPFREAVTNAVIHRNYELQNDIQVRFFDNRIEIESPGTYPRDITPKNIRSERFCRNTLVQRVLNRFNEAPNLDVGEGVDRMFLEMSQNNLYEPLFISPILKPSSVLLVLFNDYKVEYWDVINNYLEKENVISNSVVRSITGLETLKASKLLKKFVNQGLLEMITLGNNKNTFYVKKNSEDLLSQALDKKSIKIIKPLLNKGKKK